MYVCVYLFICVYTHIIYFSVFREGGLQHGQDEGDDNTYYDNIDT